MLKKPCAFWTGLLFIAATLVPFGSALAWEPIPRSDQTSLEVDFKLARYKWRKAEVALYAKHTSDPAALREPSQKFLEGFYARNLFQPNAPDWPELLKQAGELVNAKCEDPFVEQAIGIVLLKSKKVEHAKKYLEKSQAALAASAYPARCRWDGAMEVLDVNGTSFLSTDTSHWIAGASVALLNLVASSEPAEDSQRCMWAEIDRFHGTFDNFTLKNNYDDQLLQLAGLDPWLGHLLRGGKSYRAGWRAREGTFWEDLKPEERAQFAAAMKDAATEYQAAQKLHPEYPEAATKMMEVARSDSEHGTPRQWFDLAVKAQMDFVPAYDAMLESLLPRWGGSLDELNEFGLECLSTDEFETDVPYIYVQALHQIDYATGRKGTIWQIPDIYQRVKLCLKRLCDDPGRADQLRDRLGVTWLRSWQAHLSIRAAQDDDARELFELLGDNVITDLFQTDGPSMEYVRSRIYARTGAARQFVPKLGALNDAANRRSPEIKAETVALLKQARRLDKEPRAQPYYDHWHSIYDQEQLFDAGQWVDLPFNAQWRSWKQVIAGSWEFADDGSIYARGQEPGFTRLALQPTAQFPAPLIFECDIVGSETKPSPTMPAGVVLGELYGLGYPAHQTPLFFVDGAGQRVGVCGWLDQPFLTDWKLATTNRLRVKATEGYYEFYVNDQFIADKEDPTFKPGRHILLSPMWWSTTASEVRFNHARIRKWTAGHPPAFDDYAKRAEYYAAEIKENERDARAQELYGVALYYQKDFTAAIEHLERAIELQANLPGLMQHAMSCAYLLHDYQAAQEYFQMLPAEQRLVEMQFMMSMILSSAPEANLRNGRGALQLAEALNQDSEHKDASHLQALAAAQAELGRFDEALKWATQAEPLADKETKTELQKQLELYAKKKPLRLAVADVKVLARASRKLSGKKLELDSGTPPAKNAKPMLIAHWKLDATKGTEVEDAVGKHTGKILGIPHWKEGRQDGALYLDGQSHVDLGQVLDLSAQDKLTIAAWIHTDEGGRMTVISRMDESRDYRGFDVSLVDGTVYFNLVNRYPVNTIQVHTTTQVKPLAWYHILVTYDGSSKAAGVKIYFNGEAQPVNVPYDVLTGTIATDFPWRLGLRTTNMPFKGLLDDVRVYNYVLTPDEIRALQK